MKKVRGCAQGVYWIHFLCLLLEPQQSTCSESGYIPSLIMCGRECDLVVKLLLVVDRGGHSDSVCGRSVKQ